MARIRKPLEPIDIAAQSLLNAAVDRAGLTHVEIARQTGMSQNRVSIILRRDTPPATVGELAAIARMVGLSLTELVALAEDKISSDFVKDAVGTLDQRDYDRASLKPGYGPEDEINPFD